MARKITESMQEQALRLEEKLETLIHQYHNSDPMQSCIIEPVIRKRAEEYRHLTGRFFIYSLARVDDIRKWNDSGVHYDGKTGSFLNEA